MAARNDITGDSLITKASSDAYRDNWDRIFGKKKPQEEGEESDEKQAHDGDDSTATK